MTRSGGKRSNTRYMFAKPYKQKGPVHSFAYLQNFKIGDLVDIKANSSIQKGMPHKFYHGKTGRIFNITKRALGIKICKIVGNRKILKKINVRVEHVHKSQSKTEFFEKIRAKDFIRRAEKNSQKIVFGFLKKSMIYNEIHTVSFGGIKSLEPEPYSVTV